MASTRMFHCLSLQMSLSHLVLVVSWRYSVFVFQFSVSIRGELFDERNHTTRIKTMSEKSILHIHVNYENNRTIYPTDTIEDYVQYEPCMLTKIDFAWILIQLNSSYFDESYVVQELRRQKHDVLTLLSRYFNIN